VAALTVTNKVCVVDCVTLWLTNFFVDTKNDVQQSLQLIKAQTDALLLQPCTYIIISNELGMGMHAETDIGRKFTDLQGWANQYIAAKAGKVIFMVSGLPLIIKQ
jgi:adenosylcobinamide kinase / adenosylcobinamide-phosphate guanylyltransferase